MFNWQDSSLPTSYPHYVRDKVINEKLSMVSNEAHYWEWHLQIEDLINFLNESEWSVENYLLEFSKLLFNSRSEECYIKFVSNYDDCAFKSGEFLRQNSPNLSWPSKSSLLVPDLSLILL